MLNVPIWVGVITALIAAIGGLITAIYTARMSVGKTYHGLVQSLHVDNELLREMLKEQRFMASNAENQRLEGERQRLEMVGRVMHLSEQLADYVKSNAELLVKLTTVERELEICRLQNSALSKEIGELRLMIATQKEITHAQPTPTSSSQ